MEFWFEKSKSFPCYWTSYDNFITNPEEELTNMLSFALRKNIRGTELSTKIKKHLEAKGLKSAYREKPPEKQDFYKILPKELWEIIYNTAKTWLILGGWANKYEHALGLPLTDLEKERPPLNVFLQNEPILTSINSGTFKPSETTLVISSSQEKDIDHEYESLRPRVHALRQGLGIKAVGI